MSDSRPLHVFFLCTHNSARSILAEALLNHLGQGRFMAYSAGSQPRENARPNPLALETLTAEGIPIAGLRSKSWEEFARPDAPPMDLVITVCDNAAGEACPLWPGRPAKAHWSYADPSAGDAGEADKRRAFALTLQAIRRRLEELIALPDDAVAPDRLEQSARKLASTQ
ncbi:MAG: arsenate reductase ArsC [Candidatus Sericytochromatia bacterium]|nr:arsenate reductase ArsC [Candidatus Sericytochromatia bacterium]